MNYSKSTYNRSWLGLKTLLAIVNTNYYKTPPSHHICYQEWMDVLSSYMLEQGFEDGTEMEFRHLAKVIIMSSDLQSAVEETDSIGVADRHILHEIGKQLDWMWVQHV